MKKFQKTAFIFILIAALLINCTTAIEEKENIDFKNKITLASGEWSPYVSENLKYDGVVSRIVTGAFALEGIGVEYVYSIWEESIEGAKEGKWHGTLPWLKNEERAEYFYFSEPIAQENVLIFHKKDLDFNWETISDLKGHKIGGTTGYYYGEDFERAEKEGRITIERVPEDKLNFEKLAKGEIDILISELNVGFEIIKDIFSEKEAKDITYHPKSISSNNLYLLLSKKYLENKQMIELFNKGLKHLEENGNIDGYWEESRRGQYEETVEEIPKGTLTRAQLIIEYDHDLTSSSERYILIGDEYWKNNYDEIEVKLDNLIKTAKAEAETQELIDLFERQDEANLKLVDMDLRAHALVKEGKREEAKALIESGEYVRWKKIYSDTINEYLVILGVEVGGKTVSLSPSINYIYSIIHLKLEIIESDLMFLRSTPGLIGLINGDVSAKEHITNTFYQFSKNRDIYYQTRYLDESGKEIIRIDNIDNTAQIVPEDKLQNKKERYYFDDVMELDEGDVYISPLDLDIERGELENRGTKDIPIYVPVIRYGTPLFDEEKNRKGIVLLNIYANGILNILREEQKKSAKEIYLVNRDGFFLFHPDNSKEFGFMFENDITITNELGEEFMEVFTNDEGSVVNGDKEYTYKKIYPFKLDIYSSAGTPKPIAKSIAKVQGKDYFWVLIVESEIETKESFAEEKEEVFTINFTYIIMSLISILICVFLLFSIDPDKSKQYPKLKNNFILFICFSIFLFITQIVLNLTQRPYLVKLLSFSFNWFFFFLMMSLLSISKQKIRKGFIVSLYIINIILSFSLLFTNLFVKEAAIAENISIDAGSLFIVLIIFNFAYLLMPFIILIKEYFTSRDKNLKYLLYTTVITLIIIISVMVTILVYGFTLRIADILLPILITMSLGISFFKLGFLKQKRNTTMILFGVVLLLIIGLFIINTYHMTQTMKKDAINSVSNTLTIAAQSRAKHIETFLEKEKEEIGIISESETIERALKSKIISPVFRELTEEIGEIHDIREGEFYEIFVLDKNGKVFATTNPKEETGTDFSEDLVFLEGKKDIYIKDVFYDEEFGKNSIAISSPVSDDETKEFLGVVVVRIQIEKLDEIATDRTGLSETGEIYLMNKEGYMITPSRFIEDTFLKQKVDTEGSRECFEDYEEYGTTGKVEDHAEEVITFLDYRNVKVFGTHAYVPEMGWCLLAEIDEAEALAGISESLRQIWYFTIGIIISIIVLGIVFNFLLTKSLRQEVEDKAHAIVEINENLAKEVEIRTVELSKTTKELENLNINLEGEVDKKTEQLAEKLKKEAKATKAMIYILERVKRTNLELERSKEVIEKSQKELEGKNIELQVQSEELTVSNENILKAQKRLEGMNQRLKELDRLKDDFLSNVNHELRTPLTAIKSYTELLYDGDFGKPNPAQKKALKTINVSIGGLVTTINSILEISKLESGKIAYRIKRTKLGLIIYAVIRECMSLINKNHLQLNLKIAKNLPLVKCDEERIKAVLRNLINNAVKFNKKGGSITIQAGIYKKDRKFVIISVKDTGIGIKKEQLPKLFDKFYQVGDSITKKYQGSGLGLAIVSETIKAHKGRVWVRSIYGKGSVFSFTLPIAVKRIDVRNFPPV